MEGSGKVAIARFVFRNKEHLAAIRPADGVLTLTTMRFADEVVPPSELEDVLPAEQPKVAKTRGRDGGEADRLADHASFDPGAYRDEYREELLALIERKAEGKEVVTAPAARSREATKAPDLMAALEESIAAVQGKARADKLRKAAPKQSRRKPAARQGEILEVTGGRRPPGRGRGS